MAMDEDVRAQLTDIKADIRAGFTDLRGEVTKLVTQGEFNAVVARLDSAHNGLETRFNEHVQKSDLVMAKIEEYDQAVLKTAIDKVEAVENHVHAELTEYRTTTRWAIGLTATIAAALVALLQWLLPPLFGG